jgi:DNA-directed RNA polymerase subunit RPC12/RpoP
LEKISDKPLSPLLTEDSSVLLEQNLNELSDYFEYECYKLFLTHCPKCDGLYLYNKTTSDVINVSCKSYSCPYCGYRKLFKLKKGIEKVLGNYQHIRLFTFTFRTSVFGSPEHCLQKSSEIWRRFINNLRRCQALTTEQRNVQFIRVLELTYRGFVHYHVFMLDYIPWSVAQGLWNNAINTVMVSNGKNGHVNIRHSFTAQQAAKYVSSYVTKTIQKLRGKLRVWSKSNGITVFEPRVVTGEYVFVNARFSDLNLVIFSLTSQLAYHYEQIPVNLYETEIKRTPYFINTS